MITAVVIVAAAVCAGMMYAAKEEPDGNAVAIVNGYPITAQELRVYSEVNSIDLGKAGSLDLALKGAARSKLIQIEANRRGLAESVSYEELLSRMDAENSRRSEALAAGKAIYGVPAYHEAIYYSQIMNSMVHNLKNALVESGEISTSEDQLHRFYSDNLDAYAKGQDRIKLFIINAPATKEGKELLASIRQRYENGESFFDLFEQYEGSGPASAETLVITGDNVYDLSKYQGEMYSTAESMQAGDLAVVNDNVDGGNLKLLYCAERVRAPYLKFEEVKPEITLRYMDDAFDRYIDRLYEKATVKINKTVTGNEEEKE